MSFEYVSKKIKYKGSEIQTYQIGEGEKVVLALPSFPHSGLYFSFLLKHYQPNDLKLITLDMPGWAGWSDNSNSERLFLEYYADISQAVLSAYNVKKYSLLGYSFGAAVTLKLLEKMKSPDKVVLVSGFYTGKILKGGILGWLDRFLSIGRTYVPLRRILLLQFELLSRDLSDEIETDLLELYKEMFKQMDNKIITSGLYELFSSEVSKLSLEKLDSIQNVLILNSINEDEVFINQAKWLKSKLQTYDERFLAGKHEDFLLSPTENTVRYIIDYLIK